MTSVLPPALSRLHQEAVACFRQKEFQAAYQTLQSALTDYPEDPVETLKKLIACCISLNRVQEGYEYTSRLRTLRSADGMVLRAHHLFCTKLDKKLEAARTQTELAGDPQQAKWARLSYAFALRDEGYIEQAHDLFLEIEQANPDSIDARYQRIFASRRLCKWDSWQDDVAWLRERLTEPEKSPVNPYLAITYEEFTPAEILRFAAAYSSRICKPREQHVKLKPSSLSERKKIRIGFLSADFFGHATTHLMIEFLENRDTVNFETYLYSYKKKLPNDAWVKRCKQACERFIDLSELEDRDAAELIASDEIDLLVDVKGFNVEARLGILAFRPAPILLSWLAYPGSLGQPDLADYIIGDPVVTPEADAPFYTEKILNLPVCYQPNKRLKPPPPPIPRTVLGLPQDQIVFCSFNQSYKMTPQTFVLWCSLLKQTPNSVLWLLKPKDEEAIRQLTRYWQESGLSPDRLVFAPRISLNEHERRLSAADIGLDTFPYTSHTTASDLLAAGVPLIAKMGKTFTSRVSCSLLTAIGLEELIARDDKEWLRKNIRLASNPAYRKKIRNRLMEGVGRSTLFKPDAFAKAFYGTCATAVNRPASAFTSPGILFEDDYIRVIHQPGKTKDVLIVFGDLIIQADRLKFPAYAHFSRSGMRVVAIMPKGANWYPEPSMQSACHAIEKILHTAGTTRRFLYGGSMGGYAAIKYSKLLKSDSALALVPQSTIDKNAFGGHTGYDQYYVSGSGGQPIETSDISGIVHVVYDPLHTVDNLHADKICQQFSCHRIKLKGTGHHATTLLVKSGLFGDVIEAFINKETATLTRLLRKTRTASDWGCSIMLQLLFFRNPNVLNRLVHQHRVRQLADPAQFGKTCIDQDQQSSALERTIRHLFEKVFLPLKRAIPNKEQRLAGNFVQLKDVAIQTIADQFLDGLTDSPPNHRLNAMRTINGLTLYLCPYDMRVYLSNAYKTSFYPINAKTINSTDIALQVEDNHGNRAWLHVAPDGQVRLDKTVAQKWKKSSSGKRLGQDSVCLIHNNLGPMRFENNGNLSCSGINIGFFSTSILSQPGH